MEKFRKYEDALREKEKIEHFISLVDNYEVNNIDQWIIKQYALTNSISKVIKIARESLNDISINEVTREKIIQVLNLKPIDDLHKIVSRGYRVKIRKR